MNPMYPPGPPPPPPLPLPNVLLTTTGTVEGFQIMRYIGIVCGEAILGANIVKDLFADVRDVVGGRSTAYEHELQRARNIALREMAEQAATLGANAVIGIDLDYETVGNGTTMMIAASGTAVVVS
jgi:uncharacterized protein YbjQ (UPF0145 family)